MISLDRYDRAKRESCKHEHKKDFTCWSFGEEKDIPHFYCPDCKGHWFRGKFYNVREWDNYINPGCAHCAAIENAGERFCRNCGKEINRHI